MLRMSVALVCATFSTAVVADLQGRLPVTPGGSDYQAYYDTALDITWAADANLPMSHTFGVSGIQSGSGRMNRRSAEAWIAALNENHYLGVSSWRMPRVQPVDGSAFQLLSSCDGSTDRGWRISAPGTLHEGTSASEFANLHYWTLGRWGQPSGPCFADFPTGGFNTGPFANLAVTPTGESISAWTETPAGSQAGSWFVFRFLDGAQGTVGAGSFNNVWPVLDGDIYPPPVKEDTDGDGVPDYLDNCILHPNPDQRDTSGSGFGNRCDADLNGDGIVNFADLAIFISRFGTSDPDADFNGDGVVNFFDLAIFIELFGRPPGPSGLVP
ncbi:MAG: thrombospondin type 3 repeat-containing protein [Chromatiales bacterium]|nr:thrombospondin type 3 repeat-containing protein [Chromatiales bacterium]